jgi:hypothetical protein
MLVFIWAENENFFKETKKQCITARPLARSPARLPARPTARYKQKIMFVVCLFVWTRPAGTRTRYIF